MKRRHSPSPNAEREKPKPSGLSPYPRLYDKKFPFFRQPSEVGSFSNDDSRQFHHDRSQLKFYRPPSDLKNCLFDLKDGYSHMILKDDTIKEYIDGLLRWIMRNKKTFCLKPSSKPDHSGEDTECLFERLNTDFVCWRGLLTKIMCIPYEKKDDFMVAVIRFRDTYFMCEFDTEMKIRQQLQETPRQKEMCAWGFKFEQYVTADTPNGKPDTSVPVNTNSQFCSVVRSRLENHSLVFGGEVDCVYESSDNNRSYVELKTSRVIQAERQYENFCRFKLMKWWIQSFLIGIPRVVCGFRDDDGVVRELQDYPVSEMPARAANVMNHPWKPAVCFNFLLAFLEFLKENIKDNDSSAVYLLRSKPGQDVTLENLRDDRTFHFLPDWFLHWDAWDTRLTSET